MTDENNATRESGHQNPVIEVNDLDYSWPTGEQALANIRFCIRAREAVGLVGPSGAGKSTLLLHLNGLLPDPLPTNNSISIKINGFPVSKPNVVTVRQAVGLLFQEPDDQLFCSTVADDVAFGPLNLGLSQAEVRQRVTDALNAVGLINLAARSPLQLSLGERKRVCLAGLLACRPEILALDEPASSLDPRARKQLLSILSQFNGSILVASHDLDFVAQLCTRVIVLDQGRIQADGPTNEVLTNKSLLEKHGLEVPLRLRSLP
jgi:cobalt/nickel transport system ATP-binding protein